MVLTKTYLNGINFFITRLTFYFVLVFFTVLLMDSVTLCARLFALSLNDCLK